MGYSLVNNNRGVGVVEGMEKSPKPNKRGVGINGGWKIALNLIDREGIGKASKQCNFF